MLSRILFRGGKAICHCVLEMIFCLRTNMIIATLIVLSHFHSVCKLHSVAVAVFTSRVGFQTIYYNRPQNSNAWAEGGKVGESAAGLS